MSEQDQESAILELAAKYGGRPVGASPAAAGAPAAAAPAGMDESSILELARKHGGRLAGEEAPPDFRSSNVPVDEDPNTIGTAARHLWAGINPWNLTKLLPLPKALGGSGLDNPLNPVNVMANAEKLRQEGNAAWEAGDKTRAAGKYLDSLIPLLGPGISTIADELESGHYAAAGGDVLGILGPAIVGAYSPVTAATQAAKFGGGLTQASADANLAALGRAAAKRARAAGGGPVGLPAGANLTAEDVASNQFGAERGIPFDAATATGSRSVLATQKRVANSYGGEGTAADLIARQGKALKRVGRELADEVHPDHVSPEQAGAGVQGGIREVMADLHQTGNRNYNTVREAEADPANARDVPLPKAPVDDLKDWQRAQMRRIVHELDASGYVEANWRDVTQESGVNDGNAGGGQYQRTGPKAGAAVYHDIQDHGGAGLDRGDLQAELETYMGGGKETAAVKGALEVARRRYMGDTKLSTPELPASAFDVPTKGELARQTSARMAMPVDLSEVQGAAKPAFDRLAADNKAAPLMGARAEALRTLTRLMESPTHVPLMTAEGMLSDLKGLAESDEPLVRNFSQGTAARQVKALEADIDLHAGGIGGDAVHDALKAGRQAVAEKHAAGEVLDQLKAEPVEAYKQMTKPHDGGIEFLRSVQKLAPEKMREVGRAKLQEWLDFATERGRFQHADRIYAEWQRMGPETKKILFGDAKAIANIDNFVLLAKRIAENPNPSGTAHTLTALNFGSVPLTYAISKILYTDRGVQALTRYLRADPRAAARGATRATGRAAAQAAWYDLAGAAKAAGVPLDLPRAAERDDQR